MKVSTKIAAFFTGLALAVTSLPLTGMSTDVYAVSASDGYFYDQLTPQSKVFYNAMEKMLQQGVFKTGDGDFDLVANKLLTSQQAEGYGVNELLAQYGAARDAFCADHADIFYVDFSYLTLRVTTDSNGGYHVYLGAGRSDNYYTEGFTSEEQVDTAIDKYEAAVNDIVKGAKAVTVGEGKNPDAEMVKYVHDYIIDHTSYRLENACKPENIGFIRTAYGSVVKGEAVCEGYSRALKAVLDRLGIPCVLVYGVYMHNSDTPELHMWCEVEIDGVWYAVDATMDDPRGSSKNQGIDGWENQDYLLVGSSTMNRRHFSSGIMSPVEYEFTYPPLSVDGFNVEVISNWGGITVKFKDDGELEDTEAGIFYVSYNGMGVAKAAEQGKYLLMKADIYYENTDRWIKGEWGYILPDVYPAFEDFDTEVRIPAPHINYLQFAVTHIPPGDYLSDPDLTRYHGDPLLFDACTSVIYNPVGSYVKPPYFKSISPALSCYIDVEKTHHVVAVYDDVLQLESEDAVPGVVMTAENGLQNDAPCSADRFAKVENFKWDGVSTIEFDFTPSRMWLDDSALYTFSITGLVGADSLKAPIDISYYTRFAMCPCAYRPYGYYWSLFGKPTLMENFDMDVSGWETADGEKISEELVHRMVLVASNPSHSQTDEMIDMIGEEGEEVLSYQTYNINLTVCKAQVIKTGDSVRVHLGFPEGYGPDDAGVTFKAYHFFKDEQGNITGVEEIPCIITQYGLVILCKSFSPYAIVAVPADENTDTAKSVILTVSEGGTAEGADSIFTLDKGETKTVTVTAKEGYVIESISAAGQLIKITDNKKMDVTVSYNDIADISGIIDVKFVAETVYAKDEERGEAVVAAVPDNGEGSEGVTPPGETGGDQEGEQDDVTGTPADPDRTTDEAEGSAPETDGEFVDPDATDGTEAAPEATDEAAAAPGTDGGTGAAGGESGNDSGAAGENGSGSGQDSDSNPVTGLILIPTAALLAAGAGVVIAVKKKRS